MKIEKILLDYESEERNILPVLKKINKAFGFIDRENAIKIAQYFSVSLSHIYETASFYDTIKIEKQSKLVVQVCFSTHCVLNEAGKIITEVENILHIKQGDNNNPRYKLERASCFGRCAEGPIMVVNGKIYEKIAIENVYKILKEWM